MSKSSNGRPAEGERSGLVRHDLRNIACLSCALVEIAECLRTSIRSNDLASASVSAWWYLGFAVLLNRYSVRYGPSYNNWHYDAPFEANMEAWTLFFRWSGLAREAGLTEIDRTNVYTDDVLDQVQPFWEGHEIAYRSLYQDGIRLGEAIGYPLEDTGRAPFDDAPDPSDNAPVMTPPPAIGDAAAPSRNGRATEGNGTGATNGQDIEAPAGLPDLVTLDQAAALVNRSARTLERYKKRGLPRPFVLGGGGKPHEYPLNEMREWLQKTFKRPIPEVAIARYRHPKTI